MDKMRWVSLGHIRYFFSDLYVGLSTRYRYLIMVLNRVMVVNKFISYSYGRMRSKRRLIIPSVLINFFSCRLSFIHSTYHAAIRYLTADTTYTTMPNTNIQTGQDWGTVNVGKSSANRVKVPSKSSIFFFANIVCLLTPLQCILIAFTLY